ncbi:MULTISPECIES: three component ABC system middle component [Rhodospirillales]|uniref:three component ABC system middle component n=1 Tax=Rhodospirillales TaxID=204441 RepID=UPI003AA99768
MKPWNLRPFESRNLFNPAFCGLVLFRALDSYEEEHFGGMPFSLSLLVLPLCLHRDTREVFEKSSRSYFLKTAAKNQQMLVGFATRTTQMIPYTFEGLALLMERGCIRVSDDGSIRTVPKMVRKKVDGTDETISCQKVAKIIGREFARIDDRSTVYTTLGIRP